MSQSGLRKCWRRANPSPGGKVYLRAAAVTKGQQLFLFDLTCFEEALQSRENRYEKKEMQL